MHKRGGTVRIRKQLDRGGHEAGAGTIAFHLEQRHGAAPTVSTIWRILSDRGFVTAQPHDRPKSSYIRFTAEQPNERWQTDITHWTLADGTEVEICTWIDDHSRLCLDSHALRSFTSPAVLAGHWRIRHDRIYPTGVFTLRHHSRLHHIGVGRRYAGTDILVLAHDLDIRVLTSDGELIRQLTLNPTKDYQPQPKP